MNKFKKYWQNAKRSWWNGITMSQQAAIEDTAKRAFKAGIRAERSNQLKVVGSVGVSDLETGHYGIDDKGEAYRRDW